jgi:hypothetical protein
MSSAINIGLERERHDGRATSTCLRGCLSQMNTPRGEAGPGTPRRKYIILPRRNFDEWAFALEFNSSYYVSKIAEPTRNFPRAVRHFAATSLKIRTIQLFKELLP